MNWRFSFSRSSLAYWQGRLGVWASVLLLITLLIVVPIWFVWFVFFTSTFTVQSITITDAREHTIEQVRELASNLIGRNMFFLSTDALTSTITSSLSQVRDAYIVRSLPGTLKIIVQEKDPTLLLLSNKKYYFVDNNGVAYEEARLEILPDVVLPVVKNTDPEAKLTLGTAVVETSFVDFLLLAEEQLPEVTQAHIVETRIPSLSAREVHFLLDNNWEIKLDATRSLTTQLNVLRVLLSTTISSDDKGLIEYIDLRIPGRVYYKLRGASEQ